MLTNSLKNNRDLSPTPLSKDNLVQKIHISRPGFLTFYTFYNTTCVTSDTHSLRNERESRAWVFVSNCRSIHFQASTFVSLR